MNHWVITISIQLLHLLLLSPRLATADSSFVYRHDEAEELWEKNLHAKERVIGPNDPTLVVHLQNLATAYAVSGKYEECVPLLRRSLKLTTANLGPNAPQVSVPLECLATALHHTGRQYEAEPLARQALHIREAAFGSDSAIVGKLPLSMHLRKQFLVVYSFMFMP